MSNASQGAVPPSWWSHPGPEEVLLMGDPTATALDRTSFPPHDAIATLAHLPDDLQRLLRGHSVAALRRPASDGGWGIVEHLCHLRDWNVVFGKRLAAMASSESPVLETYDDELWVIDHHYRDQDPLGVLADFRRERQDLIEQMRELPDDAWCRTGHLGREQLTIARQVEHMRDHDLKHYRLIADALA